MSIGGCCFVLRYMYFLYLLFVCTCTALRSLDHGFDGLFRSQRLIEGWRDVEPAASLTNLMGLLIDLTQRTDDIGQEV